MLESLSMYSDDLMEKLLGEEDVPEALIHKIVRDGLRLMTERSGEFRVVGDAREVGTRQQKRLRRCARPVA